MHHHHHHYPPGGMPLPPGSQPPIQNPVIPYVGPLPALSDGSVINIDGFVPIHANRFHMNLQLGAGANEQVDCALHVNPRFDEHTEAVVRNSLLRRNWGSEERHGPFFPLRKGEPFKCTILTTNDHYKIAFNGAHFCEFNHRVPKENVTHLAIGDDVIVHAIAIQGPALPHGPGAFPPPYAPPAGAAGFPPVGPSPYPPQAPGPYPPGCPSGYPPMGPPAGCMPVPAVCPPPHMGPRHRPPHHTPTYNLPVPYKMPIQGGMREHRMIVINGMPKINCNRFSINLCYFDTLSKDIAFHFNPRFPEKIIVRNTKAAQSWGKEERKLKHTAFPFSGNVNYQIMILCEHNKFKVAVNGGHLLEYEHRLRNLSSIRHVIIDGDTLLSSVTTQ